MIGGVKLVCPWCFREIEQHARTEATGWRLIEHSRPDSERRCVGSKRLMAERILDLERQASESRHEVIKARRELREVKRSLQRTILKMAAAAVETRQSSAKVKRLCQKALRVGCR